jgi:hypothetical protein
MAGNTWQSAVSGEPSLGTPHFRRIRLLNGVTVGIGTYTISCTALPVGANQVEVWEQYGGGGAGCQAFCLDADGGIGVFGAPNSAVGSFQGGQGLVTLSTGRTFVFQIVGATSTTTYLECTRYWM